MSKVTSEITPVVCIQIKGEGEEDVSRVRDDGGLVKRLLKFLLDNDIDTAIRGGHSGAGAYCGFFYAEEAEVIQKWLLEQGVTINPNNGD